MSLWPRISWTTASGTPSSSMIVAAECRMAWVPACGMRAVFRMFRQIHPRHRQGTCDRLQLILLNARPRPERRLQRPGVSTGDRAPANGVQERAQPLRVIPAGLRDLGKPGRRDNLAARLDLPDKGHFLAQGVVADARQLHKCC